MRRRARLARAASRIREGQIRNRGQCRAVSRAHIAACCQTAAPDARGALCGLPRDPGQSKKAAADGRGQPALHHAPPRPGPRPRRQETGTRNLHAGHGETSPGIPLPSVHGV